MTETMPTETMPTETMPTQTMPTRTLPTRTAASAFAVHAIDPGRLDAMRAAGADGHGNPFTAYPADGDEPLRCCLNRAAAGEPIALISYAPFTAPSPWREVGPVFVHAEQCAGYAPDAGLPPAWRDGPRILRTYDRDNALDYDHITLVDEGDDIEPAVRALLAIPEVATVHVRALLPQCFAYAVTRAG
jgi:hypothetical protein